MATQTRAAPAELRGFSKKQFRMGEFFIEKGIAATALLSLVFVFLICAFIFRESATIFSRDSVASAATEVTESLSYGDPEPSADDAPPLDETLMKQETAGTWAASLKSLLSLNWIPVSNAPQYGIWPLFVGSLKIALMAILFAAPLAILAALYTSTFAPKWAREFIKPGIEILAGFPSVVIGFFALIVMATVLQNFFGWPFRLNAVVGGLAMSIAVIPVIYTISEDALNSVPRSFTEASLALGAQKWETAIYVVLPAAVPGIFAGVLLGIGRAIGETMIALMATGNAAITSMIPWEPVRTMAASIGAEMAEVVVGDFHYGVLFLLGVLLFFVSFLLNLVVELFVRGYLMRRFRGA